MARNRLEKWSYKTFKNALDSSIDDAVFNIQFDGKRSVNWIKTDLIQKAYEDVWPVISLYTGEKTLQAVTRGASVASKDIWFSGVRRYVNEVAGYRITEVWAETKTQYMGALNKAVETATNEGLGIEATQRRIRDLVNNDLKGDINIWRARRIAQTETIGAGNYGTWRALIQAESEGAILLKSWRARIDGKERVAHLDADNQNRQITQPFNVGGELLQYPGDPNGSASNVINCRCGIVAVENNITNDLFYNLQECKGH